MQRIVFAGQGLQDDDNVQASPGRFLNLYRDRVGSPEKTVFTLKAALGTTLRSTLPELFVRDMSEIGGLLYAVANTGLYQVNADGTSVLLGTVAAGMDSQVFGDVSNVCVVSGGRYYLWDGTMFSEPSSAGEFTEFSGGAFLRGYVFLSEKDGRGFRWSGQLDAASLPALNFSTADGEDDNIVRLMPVSGRLMVMKQRTIEIWALTGEANENAIRPLPGALIEVGLKAQSLVTKTRGGVFWVGDDNTAYISSGAGAQPVTGEAPAVETAFQQSNPTDVVYWEDEGHKFCAVRFSDRPAWVYDFSSGLWWERSYDVTHEPWPVTSTAKAYGSWFGGDENGQVLQFTRNTKDVGAAMRRSVVSQPIYMNGLPFTVDELEITGRVGRSDLGRDARVMVRASRDGGITFGPEKTRSLGRIGEFDKIVKVNGLGWFERSAVFEISITDPAELTLNGSGNVVLS